MFKVGGPVRTRARSFLKSYLRYRPVSVDQRLQNLSTLAGRADPVLFAQSDLTRFELRVFSQNGEDGVLVELLNRIGVTNRFFVEVGIQDGTEGNCVALADVFGWSGVFFEADQTWFELLSAKYANTGVQSRQALVSAENFEELLDAASAPLEPDVLSIDIDGNDVYLWAAMTRYRPRVLMIEYNASIPIDAPRAQPHDPGRSWDGGSAFGSNLQALQLVGRRQGYTLVHSEMTGTNAFFVRDDLVELARVDRAPQRSQNFGLTGIRQAPSEPPGGWVSPA
jgi:hypothetical protein